MCCTGAKATAADTASDEDDWDMSKSKGGIPESLIRLILHSSHIEKLQQQCAAKFPFKLNIQAYSVDAHLVNRQSGLLL